MERRGEVKGGGWLSGGVEVGKRGVGRDGVGVILGWGRRSGGYGVSGRWEWVEKFEGGGWGERCGGWGRSGGGVEVGEGGIKSPGQSTA